MGVVILAGDDREFRIGNYIVMHNEMTSPPTAPGTTYILHTRKFSEAEILEWGPLISYRLVVILPRAPSLSKKCDDLVIIHHSLPSMKQSWSRFIDAMLRWDNRRRAFEQVKELPIPLALSVWKANRPGDIRTARLLAQVTFTLPDPYAHAVLAYSIRPDRRRPVWGKKKKGEDELPIGFRLSDAYCFDLIRLAPEIANVVRSTDPDALPKGVKKKPEVVSEWL